MPIYKSTAEFVKTKLVTIPSCEHVNRYAVETEGIVEEKVFYDHENNRNNNSSEKSETKNEKDTKKEESKLDKYQYNLHQSFDIIFNKSITNFY